MKERGEDESFALAESGKHDHYLRGATSEAVFNHYFVCAFFVGFWRIKLYIKMSQHVAETVDLDSVCLIIVVKNYFS